MSTVIDLDSGYRLGFRVALASLLSKKEKQQGVRDSTLHRRRWRARCISLGELSSAFPFLEGYSRFTFKRASCDARDVFPDPRPEKDKDDRELIFRCHQSWICPWCSTRPTIKMIKKVYLTLKAHKDDLDGMVWTTRGWEWNLGPINSADPKAVDLLLDDLISLRHKAATAVVGNKGNTAALLSRTRVIPGRATTKGSPPPLVVTHRFAFLSRPNALVVRRWSDKVGTLGPAFTPRADDPRHSVSRYVDLCRYLAGYPAGLAFSEPLVLARLLRVKEGIKPKRRLIGCSFNF